VLPNVVLFNHRLEQLKTMKARQTNEGETKQPQGQHNEDKSKSKTGERQEKRRHHKTTGDQA
jgi:hypothetical protein